VIVARRAALAGVMGLVLIATGCTPAPGDIDPIAGDVPADTSPPATSSSPSESQIRSDVDAQVIEHADNRYLVVTLPLDQWDIRVDWQAGERGTMLGDVVAADSAIAVATNAGIFTTELAPGGLLVSDGEELVPLNLSEGGGNFHLMPNAVFALYSDGTAAVMNSTDYDSDGVEFATQSGPALVLDAKIHSKFTDGSTNLAVRSGVGVSPDGQTVFLVKSWSLTNFYDFATLYADELGVENALYLDGDISDLWVDQLPEPGPFAGPYAGVITARPHE